MAKKSTLKLSARTRNRRVTALEQAIRLRADISLSVLGMAFVRNGSGRFLNIRSAGDRVQLSREARSGPKRPTG